MSFWDDAWERFKETTNKAYEERAKADQEETSKARVRQPKKQRKPMRKTQPTLARVVGELGEIQVELLPVIVCICPKCGKLESVAEKKTKKKISDRI